MREGLVGKRIDNRIAARTTGARRPTAGQTDFLTYSCVFGNQAKRAVIVIGLWGQAEATSICYRSRAITEEHLLAIGQVGGWQPLPGIVGAGGVGKVQVAFTLPIAISGCDTKTQAIQYRFIALEGGGKYTASKILIAQESCATAIAGTVGHAVVTVSYTHLTLPTNREV